MKKPLLEMATHPENLYSDSDGVAWAGHVTPRSPLNYGLMTGNSGCEVFRTVRQIHTTQIQ